MSRLEPDEDLRKRYAAMEDRLGVNRDILSYLLTCSCYVVSTRPIHPLLLQVVRKRLNRPMTLAEKVSYIMWCCVTA